MKFRKSHREEVPVSMDDTAPSAPEGAAPAASGPNDAPADPAAPRYKFPTWFDLLALVGLFVVIQLVVAFVLLVVAFVLLVVAFVLLLAGARMPDAAALGSADETVAARAHAAAAQFNFYAYPLTMGLMIGLTLIYRRLRGGNRRLGRYAVRGLNPALILWGMLQMAATNVVLEPLLQLLPEIPDFYGRGWRALLLTVVMAPLAEEFLCRGILLDAARANGGAAYGLLFSALFFGVIHFYPAAVVNAFVMGLLLGFIYIRSNSLYIVVILHAFNNALAMLLLTLGYAHTTLYELMSAHGLKMLYTVVYGVSLGIFLVAGYMVWKTIARLREQEQAAAEAQ